MSAALAQVEELLPLLPDAPLDLEAFTDRYGPLPRVAGRESALLEGVEASGLTGRGGGGFPTARKLRAVRSRRRTLVVANGAEGEPVSSKDEVLLSVNPHLVLDGALIAAALVGAEQAVVAVSRRGPAHRAVRAALDERPDGERVRLASVPRRFIAGEESALVHWVGGGDLKPTLARPFERGVLVQNVETLASLGLVCRGGEARSALATVSGAVARPGVVEADLGTPLRELVARCGGLTAPAQAVLAGGYFGTWLAPRLDLPLGDRRLGAGAIVVLPEGTCGIAETARVAAYLAQQSAGQCGPCVFGLPAVAECLAELAEGHGDPLERLPRLHAQIARRGACAHPDGAIAFVESALRVFGAEVDHHLAGRCTARDHEPVLPT